MKLFAVSAVTYISLWSYIFFQFRPASCDIPMAFQTLFQFAGIQNVLPQIQSLNWWTTSATSPSLPSILSSFVC